MATDARNRARRAVIYPTSDGKPMAETEVHLWAMIDLIQGLADRFADDPMVYVGADMLMYYEEGNKYKSLAPDVFVVLGIPKLPRRDNYLVWEEGKAPDVVVEVTSKTTKARDQGPKLDLYRDVLRVPEYFQFDPTEDYLRPSFQGFVLRDGEYRPIEPVDGRLPSALLGLHLERAGTTLRLYDPAAGRRIPTPSERAEAESARAEAESARAEAESARALTAEAENDRLRRELEELRRSLAGGA